MERVTTQVQGREAGVEGNARLTAVNGVVLLVLLFVEGITILEIHGLITLHVFVGFILVGPVLLKCATTIYRFARYYSRDPAYVRRGTPPPFLRVLGPLVIISSVAVIGTGAGLLAVRPGQADLLLFAHKATFVVWFGVMALHVLGHLTEAAKTARREMRPAMGDPATRRRLARTVALIAALVIGVGVAATFTPNATAWVQNRHEGH